MTQEELNQQAVQVYAAIGELTIRKKQFNQQIDEIDSKLIDLEKTIVELSKVEVEPEITEEEYIKQKTEVADV